MEIKKVQCPICKEMKPKYDFVSLKDGEICCDCANQLVVAYPVTYQRNPNYQSYWGLEKDNGGYLISAHSEYKEVLINNGQPYEIPHFDGIETLSLAEYPQKLASMEGVRMKLRRQYDANSAFLVEGGFPIRVVRPLEVGIFEMRKLLNAYLYYGRCVVGDYARKDAVTLVHNGTKCRTRVLGAMEYPNADFSYLEKRFNDKDKENQYVTYSWLEWIKSSHLTEGYAGYIILEKETPVPSAGDMILKL